MARWQRIVWNSLAASTLMLLCHPASEAADAAKVDFARDIRPILAQHCAACHGPDEKTRKAKLRLDLRESALARKAIVPGDAKRSHLLERIESTDESEQMPPPDAKKPLSDRQKQLLRTWIEQGAPYAQHWAFEAPKRPAVPQVKDSQWIRNEIDAFVLQRLEREGLRPAPEADRATLLRRVSLDLTGLPPSIEDLDAFLADSSADAYEKVVDRLLASPRYGERMALAWLDAARYADTNGFNNDEDRTQWPWRDWVIEAFRGNMPYDRFVVEQVAGDLLPNATLAQKVATGFLRNQVHNTEGGIIDEEYRAEYVADRVHTTATVLLGLSLQCARCHDHKFDPISQREYYQFFAFFNNLIDKQAPYNANFIAAEPYIHVPSPEQAAKLDQIETKRTERERQVRDTGAEADKRVADWQKGLSSDDLRKLDQMRLLPATLMAGVRKVTLDRIDKDHAKKAAELADLNRQKKDLEKSIPAVMVMQEMAKPRETFVLKRGAYDQPAEKVGVGVPEVLPRLPTNAPKNRLALARWLVDPANPLTARVAVNRWWQMIFGTGLVKTVEDFGNTGELPSHPELLDFLATQLVQDKWDVKAMMKRIVTSATYRQSSRLTKDQLDRDPENRLLARGPRNRLPAEMVRDNALAISGLLKEKVGGPSVKPYQPAGLWEDVTVDRRMKYVADKGDDLYRRGMYTFWKRTCPPPSLMNFDAPNREVCVARRATTNTPLQALVLLNDPTYVEAARKLAERMILQGGKSPESRLAFAYKCAVAREPSPAEERILMTIQKEAEDRFRTDKDAAIKLLAVGASPRNASLDTTELAAWTTVASMILNLDETISKR